MTSAQTPTQSALAELQPLPGATGVLAVELACEGGRVALVRDPAQQHAMLSVHAEGRTVALRLDDTAQRVLALALRESVASAIKGAADMELDQGA